mgnify:CR=1 FL=1
MISLRIRALLMVLFVFAWLSSACSSGGGGGSSDAGPQVSTLSILEFVGVSLSPAFNPATFTYTGEAASTVDSVTFSATSAGGQATVTLDGAALGSGTVTKTVDLDYGANPFVVSVTSGDGATTSTYTVTVVRAEGPRLSGLGLSEGVLSPAFDPEVTTYDVAVGGLIPALTITPSTVVANAAITVAGAAVASGQTSASLQLAPGLSDIVVRVSTPQGEIREYVLAITRAFVEEGTLFGGSFGDFGGEVAIDGDTAVVGASGGNSGRASVYVRDGATWTLEQTLTPLTGSSFNDRYARDVAISGDTIVVGAPQIDVFGSNAGAVYVYTRSGVIWSEQAVLISAPLVANGSFGTSVAIDGDTLVAGGGNDEAFVFTRAGSTWTQRAIVTGSNTQSGDYFAETVTLHGGTLVIGACGEDGSSPGVNGVSNENADESGAVYVFTGSGSTWQQQAYIKASNVGDYDRFGSSIAVHGDTLVVGAYQEDSSSTGVNSTPDDSSDESGAAYVFTRSNGTWSQQAYLKAFNTDPNDRFGSSVALSGETILVGASGERTGAAGINPIPDNDGTYRGAAYVFTRTASSWSQQAFVKAADTMNGRSSFFGAAVALSGATFVVGAFAGSAAYIYR